MAASEQIEDGEHIQYHRDGSLMRSGSFAQGLQVGEWTTYDRNGATVKVTQMKKPR
jgi:antitoxin component YwqK of YwqJK toxin-antitoxin module